MEINDLRSFLEEPRVIKVLATADDQGGPNAAVFGSPRVLSDGRVMLALGNNRSWQNLEQNRHAVLMAFSPAEQLLAWRGVRVYLELEGFVEEGPELEGLREEVSRDAGKMAARMVRRAAVFTVVSQRPLLDVPVS